VSDLSDIHKLLFPDSVQARGFGPRVPCFSFKNSLSVLFFCTKWRRNVRRGLPVTWFLALISTNIQRGREITEMRFTLKQNLHIFSHTGLFLESFSRSFPYHVSWTCKFSTWQPMLCCFRQNLFWVRNLHFVLHVLWEFWPPCTSDGRAETLSGTCQRAEHISARTN
jgi:hypothetical protein